MDISTYGYPFISQCRFGLFTDLRNYKLSCYKYSYTDLCGHISYIYIFCVLLGKYLGVRLLIHVGSTWITL